MNPDVFVLQTSLVERIGGLNSQRESYTGNFFKKNLPASIEQIQICFHTACRNKSQTFKILDKWKLFFLKMSSLLYCKDLLQNLFHFFLNGEKHKSTKHG